MSFRESFQRYVEWGGYRLASPLRRLVEYLMERRGVVFLYRVYGSGLGDTLAITAILDALNRERPTRAIVFSKVAPLFHAHPQVILNLDYEKLPKLHRSLLKSFAKYFRGARVIHVGREKWLLGTPPWNPPGQDYGKPWLQQMIPDLPQGLPHLREAAPQVWFAAEEVQRYERKFAQLPNNYAVVKASVGANRPSGMAIKNWDLAKFQEVIDNTDLAWVQIGDAKEPSLNNVIAILGQTTLREALFVLSKAKLVLTVEGFISHAAAAFGMPVVVVFSGFHDARNLCYPTTIPVVAHSLPACAPCYLPIDGVCATPEKPCTGTIGAKQVIAAVACAARSA
jgi:ADP-heptose:LPS heptosyltransferase